MKKYRNKYRVPSARAPFWDYGWNAFYFITICTHNRICWFGNVVSEKMALSDIGKIVKTEWIRTFQMRPDMNLMMGEYVVMPNHFHAIIGIGNNQYNSPQNEKRGDGCDDIRNIRRDAMHCVSQVDAMHCVSTGPNGQNGPNGHNLFTSQNKFGPQSKNLASIIRGFKIGVTKNARDINRNFSWQPRYHDIIIHDENSFQTISKYIINNPAKWTIDDFYIK